MANETNYYFSELIAWKEDTENTIPTSPKGIVVAGLIQNTVKETQKTETNPTLNNGGQASKKDRGTSDYAGNLECKTMGDIMPFIATHTFGEAGSKAELTSEAWVTATAYSAFDEFDSTLDVVNKVIKHTNGTNMLVCYKAGTSGATEPDLTGYGTTIKNGDKIVDGTTTWIVRPLLYKYTGESESCLPSFGFEVKGTSGCGTATYFKKRFQQAYMQSFEISKTSGQIIHKYAIPVIAGYATDNESNDSFESIVDVAGYTSQTMTDRAFGYDDCMVQFDDLEPVNSRNFRMMINRNISLEDATKRNTKISNIPQMTVEGEVSLKFTKEQYAKSYDNEASEIKVLCGKSNGDVCHITFPYVERDRMDPDWSTNEPAYLTTPLTASGDNTTKTFTYALISELDYD